MTRQSYLSSLRGLLSQKGAAAMIISSNDCHFGEYVPEYFQVRKFLSGFSGSAGTLVVSLNEAALWTDSRYFIAAEAQLRGSGIALMKEKMDGTLTIAQWIIGQGGGKVLVDGALFSYSAFRSLASELSPAACLEAINDPFIDLWPSRPELVFHTIELMPENISGKSVVKKHAEVVAKLACSKPFAYIISACDEIMWLCNIRGCDIEYNSVALSYAVVTAQLIHLFCNLANLSQPAKTYLLSQKVVLHEYSDFGSFLSKISADTIRVFDPSAINITNYEAAFATIDKVGREAVSKYDPTIGGTVAMLRCRKNAVEVAGFKKALLHDGVAWVKLLKYIDDNVQLAALTEGCISEKLIALRKECSDYCGESFEPIVALNANAASAHYSIEDGQGAKITTRGLMLMDTGAHYYYGTTDTTRTLFFGEPDSELCEQMKIDYTLVLKGVIALSKAIFPANTRGSQLDILARGPMYATGKMYYHGTSHGIGHRLCVHESPQIRKEESPIVLDEGMVLSIEPAVYLEGRYGIRTENMAVVVPYMTTEFGKFFHFETLTLVPIESSVVDFGLLNDDEKQWLKSFNENVFDSLAPYLSESEKLWYRSKYYGK